MVGVAAPPGWIEGQSCGLDTLRRNLGEDAGKGRRKSKKKWDRTRVERNNRDRQGFGGQKLLEGYNIHEKKKTSDKNVRQKFCTK